MKKTIILYTIIHLLIVGTGPAYAINSGKYNAGLYIAEYEKICYAVTIKEISSKSTIRFRRMSMFEVPCSGTGTLPRISGTWRKGIESYTGTCFLELEISLIARGSRRQILMGQADKDCS